MNIAFLGIGSVGAPLAGNLAKAGHDVPIAARDFKALEGEPKGKFLVDCAHPIGAGITQDLENKMSGAESGQVLGPGAHFGQFSSI